jgi:LmbE family N-acetylglucosaminyl deacetylase
VAVLAFGPVTAEARTVADCAAGSTLYTVAHADDSILFQDPDIRTDIASGRCVRTIFLTAGDAGLDATYWQGRENGVAAAYADLAARPNVWRTSDAGIPGHPARLLTLVANPAVSVVFLRLPDGQSRGRGFGSTGLVSLEKLWLETVPSIAAVDGTSSYTRAQLVASLAAAMTTFRPDTIRTQDFLGAFGDGDHSDHHAAAYFTRAAGELYLPRHRLIGYVGYGMTTLAANLSAADAAAKQQTFFAYAPFDPPVCQTVVTCEPAAYAGWWSRQYVNATIDQGSGPPPVPVAAPAPAAPAPAAKAPETPAQAALRRAKAHRRAALCRRTPNARPCKPRRAPQTAPTRL